MGKLRTPTWRLGIQVAGVYTKPTGTAIFLRMSDARAAVHHGGLGEEPQWQFRRIGARQALASRSHRALFGAAVRMWRAVANE